MALLPELLFPTLSNCRELTSRARTRLTWHATRDAHKPNEQATMATKFKNGGNSERHDGGAGLHFGVNNQDLVSGFRDPIGN